MLVIYFFSLELAETKRNRAKGRLSILALYFSGGQKRDFK